MDERLEIKRDGKTNKIYSHIRGKYLIETPEEKVRQNFLLKLVNEYGYSLEQIGEEESVVGRGSAQARADFLIWKNEEEKKDGKRAFIVVECKADYISINQKDYEQGDRYVRQENAELFITHNSKETKIFKVCLDKRPKNFCEIKKIPTFDELNDEKELKKIYDNLKEFKENEFATVLKTCHDIIRNREKLDPAAAFDEIAKILFMKVYAERTLLKNKTDNLFTKKYIEEGEKKYDFKISNIFEKTKKEFKGDEIFKSDEAINLRDETIKSIVEKLQVYNLSKTSSDIKGIAFEKFLGRTFRGEIGQFFTPRPLVEFMVDFIKPKFGKIICDPASGSGGFLIKYFENVKEKIEENVKLEYEKFAKYLDKKDENFSVKLEEKQKEIKKKYLDEDDENSQIYFLSHKSIYGTDANERMARTSKMNMIMHGDGHGGIHHNDGLYDINGIFEGRFDFVLTNPPFGSSVEKDDKIKYKDVCDAEAKKYYKKNYEDLYNNSVKNLKERDNKPIGDYFEIKKGNSAKTEIFFLERCLNLVKKGGVVGIVLPEGILNNPSLKDVRKFCEDRAKILAIISIPQDVFISAKATVKTSIIFFKKFTEQDKKNFEEVKIKSKIEVEKLEEIKNLQNKINDLVGEISKLKRNQVKEKKKEIKLLEGEYDKKFKEEFEIIFKKKINYKIFMAEVENAGISTTGEIDLENNELPKVIKEYEKFLENEKNNF